MNCLHLPSPVVSLAFSPSLQPLLAVASQDGTVRFYEPPFAKVSKAIRNLGSEVSSLVFPEAQGDVWIACGQHVLCFSLDTPRMIMERGDAKVDIRLTEENEDVLNEIDVNGTHLAYTLDSGVVGVMELKTQVYTAMKTVHKNLCANVSFIPDRPRELVSGGYDSILLHFDFHLRTHLSSLKICPWVFAFVQTSPKFHLLVPAGPSEPSVQVSLSPPFVLSLSVAQNGLVACGLADGRVWLGSGGEKPPKEGSFSSKKKKKHRKWEGLRADDGNYFKIAEGPIVAISFASPHRLVSLTLLGTLTLHEVADGSIQGSIWTSESSGLTKANTMAVNSSSVAVGGIDSDEKGILLLLPLQDRQNRPDS